jgi:HEAT repeat protein
MTRRTMIGRAWTHLLPFSNVFGYLPGPRLHAMPGPPKATRASIRQAWETLEALAASNSAQRRRYATGALGLIAGTDKKARMLMENALANDKEADLRSYAASVLGEEKVRGAIPALRSALRDGDAGVAFAAAKALFEMGDHSGSTLLRQVLTGQVDQAPGLIEGALRDARKTLHDPKQLAMIGINEAAGALLGPASLAVTVAEQGLRDKGATARALSARLLATDRSAASRQALVEGLGDSNVLVRVASCEALAMQGDRSSLPHIQVLLEGKNEAARAMAAAEVLRLSSRRARKG